jgi:hypothetical protein
VYVGGLTEGGNLAGPPLGSWDAWLARYDDAGNQVWLLRFGSFVDDGADALAPDGAGGVLVAGFSCFSLFGPSAGSGWPDAWIAHYDTAGNRTWAHQLGTPAFDFAHALAPDGAGGFLVAGITEGSLAGPSAGRIDTWIARYGGACYPDCNPDGALTVADFGCFQTKFVQADPYADCDSDGKLTPADFGCFQTKFAAGCP